ncbi:LuxR family transcriptional regulator [Burkholderia cepacia]|uniref:LuxR family transcriptional regulator n=1 Tax=Burkholderia cepacia TaxID=292 RepID=A0A103Z9K8_BURCE|nr:response regulator transcription factor [Burkholderia cepacia]KVK75924.1 LuxR family transcriptional regulator [Burkholderia cepacia]
MIRVLIADDHAIVRGGIKQIMAMTTDIVAVGEAVHGQEAIEKIRMTKCDLLLLDMNMPGISGIALLHRLRAAQPKLPILVLSMHDEAQIVARALRAGANGYATKDSDPDILLDAIRKLVAGGRFIDPKLVDVIVFDKPRADSPGPEVLSDREFQVLQMLAAGQSINDIANVLARSAKTISTHKKRLMDKLEIANNADLIHYAIAHRLAEGQLRR